MTFENVIPLLTGPASALGVCLLIGLGVYRLLRDFVVPMVRRAIDRHLDQVDEIIKKHSAEHERIMAGLDAVVTRMEAGVCERPDGECRFRREAS